MVGFIGGVAFLSRDTPMPLPPSLFSAGLTLPCLDTSVMSLRKFSFLQRVMTMNTAIC